MASPCGSRRDAPPAMMPPAAAMMEHSANWSSASPGTTWRAAQRSTARSAITARTEECARQHHLRDFLVQTKQFASTDNAELFAEEVEKEVKEVKEAKAVELQRLGLCRGWCPRPSCCHLRTWLTHKSLRAAQGAWRPLQAGARWPAAGPVVLINSYTAQQGWGLLVQRDAAAVL